jgi:hypothetical protein
MENAAALLLLVTAFILSFGMAFALQRFVLAQIVKVVAGRPLPRRTEVK